MEILIIVLLVVLSGLFSGLNLGLISLRPQDLKRKMELGDQRATAIYPIRKHGNLLLVTIVLANVAVNAILAIFLGSIASGLVAWLLTTVLITVFGEITPQAIISRYALDIGAKAAWFVRLCMYILYPFAKPLAYLLDRTLGDEFPDAYNKQEVVQLIEDQSKSQISDIEAHEEKIAKGALTYADKKIKEVMTPRSAVIGFDERQKFNEAVFDKIKKENYTRYPVYHKSIDNIIGILYIQDLIHENVDEKEVGEIAKKKIIKVDENERLDTVLKKFLNNRQHLFIVNNKFAEFVGILTIEDILEEIIGDEIVDEFDAHKDVRKVAEHRAHRKLNS